MGRVFSKFRSSALLSLAGLLFSGFSSLASGQETESKPATKTSSKVSLGEAKLAGDGFKFTEGPTVDADGNVWEINRNIRVRVPQALIDDDLLLVSAQLTRDVTGTRSMLTLQPREAFAAYTPPARGRGRGKRTEKGLWLTDADVAAATARARSAR